MDKTSKLSDKLTKVEPKPVSYFGYNIPVCKPFYLGKEGQYISQAIQSEWISGNGEFLDRFEKEFAKKTGATYGIACNSGTSALHLAYRLIGIKPGDEVIVPTFTMVSTVTPLIELGATPVFIDCDEKAQIDVTKIEAAITPKTKAVVGVHIYGHPVDIDALEAVALKHNLKVVYDAAEAHGAQYKRQPIGKYGDVVTYSFYANKLITTGEGGMITVNNPEYYRRAQRLVDEYMSPERHFYHEDYGYSYRMSNLLAAIGLAQTESLEKAVAIHREHEGGYRTLLAGVPGISFLPESKDVSPVSWMHCILVDEEKFGMDRNGLRDFLASRGIETRTFFIPMHAQPVMIERFGATPEGALPVSEKMAAEGMYLPSSTGLSGVALLYITDRIKEAYVEARKGKGATGGTADSAKTA